MDKTEQIKTYLYELKCEDESITDTYLGYTTVPVKEFYENLRNPDLKHGRYMDFINKKGGIDAWYIQVIGVFNSREEANAEKLVLLNMHTDLYTLNKNGFMNPPKRRYMKKAVRERRRAEGLE
jgi:hypothetical protein